ncbi:hypothetical protein DL763_009262 [Monosporascus cannonballus]|nr:hypothetical protein DL763_009262 [Monosporascus cannonballus]
MTGKRGLPTLLCFTGQPSAAFKAPKLFFSHPAKHLDRFVVAVVHLQRAPKSAAAFVCGGCGVVPPPSTPPPHPPPPRGRDLELVLLPFALAGPPRTPMGSRCLSLRRRAAVPGNSPSPSFSTCSCLCPCEPQRAPEPNRLISPGTLLGNADILQAEPASERGWQGEHAKS